MDIIAAQKKHEDAVMQLPNVTGLGIGLKDDNQVIKVFVTRKLPEMQLRADEMIPKTLEGYQTDVEETGIISIQPL